MSVSGKVLIVFLSVQTGCPAYFRLKLIHSGVALQIVALNIKHNHPLEPLKEKVFGFLIRFNHIHTNSGTYLLFQEVVTTGKRGRKAKIPKTKADKKLRDEIKSEEDSESDKDQVINNS